MTEFSAVVQEVTFAPAASPETVFRVVLGGTVSVDGGGGGVSAHADLTGRDAANSHPIAAITGLQAALDAKASATMSVGGALEGSLPNPGLNNGTVRAIVGAMAGDGLVYADSELSVVAPPHSVAWCLVDDTFDPTVTAVPVTTSTNVYIYTGVEGDTYEHAGLWKGMSPDGTPALLERHPHTATTGDMFTSRTWIDLRSGSIELPTEGPVDGVTFPAAWVSPQRVDAIISGNNGPNLPVWSLVVEQDRDGQSVAPSIDFLADVDTSTAPTDGQALVWDDGDEAWKPGTVAGGGTVDVVSNVAQDRLLGRTSSGSGDSEELTATQARSLLNVADGSTRTPLPAPGVISAAKFDVGYAGGTPLSPFVSTSTVALSAGQMAIGYCNRAATSAIVGLSLNVSATSLTAGQSVSIVCYELDSAGFPTGAAYWSESLTVGTSTGFLSTGTVSVALPLACAVGVLNPSGNAGSVTFTAAQAVQAWVHHPTTATRSGLLTSGHASAPDVTSMTIQSTPASTKLAPTALVPIIWARRA